MDGIEFPFFGWKTLEQQCDFEYIGLHGTLSIEG